ncbi:MAG: NAD(P)H-hydrate dehydratase, partial [Pseudomonadales bacterium]
GMAHAYALNSSAECISANDTAANDIDMVQEAAQADVIVDALLGIGLSGEVRPNYQAAIEVINVSGKPIVAVDIPSGLSADTGAVQGSAQGKAQGACVKATHTVTFVGRKLGLYTSDGPEYCGQVHFSSLDIPAAIYTDLETDLETATVDLLELNSLQAQLKPRHRNTHKRAQGHLLVIGGNEGMGGAALLAAEAALYAGAGLVSVATHSSNVGAILARRPELMPKPIARTKDMQALLNQATALVIGPGLGADSWAKSLFKAALQANLPTVIDADGLNLLAENKEQRDNWTLTPHPGEAARLLGRSDIQADRLKAVKELQSTYGGASLLKGAGTLIATANQVSLNPYGNPGMAVAGTGDVLAGLIGAL